MKAARLPGHNLFVPQPCAPAALNEERLRKLASIGCIWAVTRKDLHPALRRVRSEGLPAHAIDPSGWSALSQKNGRREKSATASGGERENALSDSESSQG